MKGTNSGTY